MERSGRGAAVTVATTTTWAFVPFARRGAGTEDPGEYGGSSNWFRVRNLDATDSLHVAFSTAEKDASRFATIPPGGSDDFHVEAEGVWVKSSANTPSASITVALRG
jgi:hypothetical protein